LIKTILIDTAHISSDGVLYQTTYLLGFLPIIVSGREARNLCFKSLTFES